MRARMNVQEGDVMLDVSSPVSPQASFVRFMAQIFSGLVQDIKRRAPYYLSDYRDGMLVSFPRFFRFSRFSLFLVFLVCVVY